MRPLPYILVQTWGMTTRPLGTCGPSTPGVGNSRRGQHLHAGIDVEVILFGYDGEIMQASRDFVCGVGDADRVVHAVIARMGDPLAAGHELPFGIFAEAVAHTAVASGQATPPSRTAASTGLACSGRIFPWSRLAQSVTNPAVPGHRGRRRAYRKPRRRSPPPPASPEHFRRLL